ncbi:MAG TPA: SpoIID/LytB domain-containing protein [Vicinamibacterales bacterium]|nr:SpoIID/LytB domain-containing protein [Vicinamibacterales bacterium]
MPVPSRVYQKTLALGVALVVLAAASGPGVTARAGQAAPEVADVDLAKASRGATVRIGSPGRGRDALDIPLELYVAQVLSAEGEPNAPDASAQALAVAIRTYALFNAGRHQREGFDLCDTTHCQVLRASSASSRRAAQATLGLVLTYQGAPADLYYSASCGGHTERAADVWPKVSLPYLEAVEDDVHGEDPYWTLDRTLDEIRAALARAGVRGGRLEDVVVETRTASGRVGRVGLPGLEPASMNSNDFRLAIGSTELRSTAFTLARSGDRLTFTGRGYGHGVGMCVIGAGRRAARGESAAQILARYYPGLALEDLSRVRPGVAPRDSVLLPAPPALPAAGAAKPTSLVRALVPAGSRTTAADLERMAGEVQAKMAQRLGVTASSLTIRLHGSIDAFRRATGQPWWMSTMVRGREIDLAPAALLEQRDGLDRAVARAVAEALVAPDLADRHAWVRVGAARYFTGGERPAEGRLRCPADADLTAAISAAAQREAESRAEACFAQAMGHATDWREIR